MPDVGDIVDGYRLDAVIGRGGMGTVYRATDQALEKTVALKVIAPHLADDDTFARRFREEAKALARLDADGIVDVYTMRETEDALFFVMEHVEGPSLQTVLQRRGALDPDEALSLLRQVLEAVQQAHTSGVLHRDLKPSNILIDAEGRAVITDFGLAKILASDANLTATHDQLGTVAYMSPEQVEGLQNVSKTSDLFSVGLIAYECLTGQLPFDRSESDFVVQRAIVEASFPPPSAYEQAVPPSVEQVVMDLLAKDPSARPPDAQTALARLPRPASKDEGPILDPDAGSDPDTAFSVMQWVILSTSLVLVLVGTYAGVRATLGLPILSLSTPSPQDSARAVTTAGTTQPETPRLDDETPGSEPPDTSESKNTSDPGLQTAGASSSDSQQSASPPPSSSASQDEAQSAAEEPSPSPGVLTIQSDPDGASVQLGETQVGRTPLILDDLAPGAYQISLRQENYRPFETTIRISAADTTQLTPTLSPRPAVVRLRVRPSGKVRIDGALRSASSDESVVDSLSPGSHRIEVNSALGRWETQLQLEAGERYEDTVDFTQRVEVAVTARTSAGTPLPNAAVQVDGETVGYTPQRLTRRVGQHTIRVEKEGYAPVERTVQFESQMETPLVFELSPDQQ